MRSHRARRESFKPLMSRDANVLYSPAQPRDSRGRFIKIKDVAFWKLLLAYYFVFILLVGLLVYSAA